MAFEQAKVTYHRAAMYVMSRWLGVHGMKLPHPPTPPRMLPINVNPWQGAQYKMPPLQIMPPRRTL